jgi:hypothetical protein
MIEGSGCGSIPLTNGSGVSGSGTLIKIIPITQNERKTFPPPPQLSYLVLVLPGVELLVGGLNVEPGADGGPEGLLPRDEVVLQVGVVVAQAQRVHPLPAQRLQLLVRQLSHRVKVLVGFVPCIR